jgi:hypothetical protein
VASLRGGVAAAGGRGGRRASQGRRAGGIWSPEIKIEGASVTMQRRASPGWQGEEGVAGVVRASERWRGEEGVTQGRWRRRRRGEEAVVLRMQVDAGVRRPASSAPR